MLSMTKEEIRTRVQGALPTLPYRERVKRLSLFGSHLRGDAKPDSDVDLLVELSEPVGLFDFVGMQFHLERSLERRVDLLTPEALSKYFRHKVLDEAEPLYEQ